MHTFSREQYTLSLTFHAHGNLQETHWLFWKYSSFFQPAYYSFIIPGILSSNRPISLVLRPFPPPVFDRFVYSNFQVGCPHWNTILILKYELDESHSANQTVLLNVIGQFEIQYCIFGQPAWNLWYCKWSKLQMTHLRPYMHQTLVATIHAAVPRICIWRWPLVQPSH